MRKKNLRFSVFVMVVLSLLVLLSVPTYASELSDSPVTVKIPVSCTGKNSTETFIYTITPAVTEFEQVKTDQLTLKDGETGMFVISYTYPGTYHYTVCQESGTDDKTSYDDTEYDVDVYVTVNEEGATFADPIVYIKGGKEKKDSCSFVNTRENASSGSRSPANGPKTGDNAAVIRYVGLCLVSVIVLLWIVIDKKRKEHER